MSTTGAPAILDGQKLHLVAGTFLLGLAWFAWGVLGEPAPVAFWAAVAVPVFHQVFVWLTWRLELRTSWTSRTLGFRGYLVGFFVLFGGRFVSLSWLAWLDQGSLGLDAPGRWTLTTVLLLPGLYAMYSVQRYFGLARAAGGDHFDPSYREMPLVREGIFRFTSNGMYVYAFLLFWAIAVAFDSSGALVVVGYSHAYIWVHFHGTEKLDMRFLYGADPDVARFMPWEPNSKEPGEVLRRTPKPDA